LEPTLPAMWSPANQAAFPSQEETRHAKEAIYQLELVLKDAYELLEQAKTRVYKLVGELDKRKAWIAPIRRLPVEILSEIFIFSSEVGGLVPLTITEVSRHWREVILATPRAWSRVYANLPGHESYLSIDQLNIMSMGDISFIQFVSSLRASFH
jgi:hypothetical protein